MVVKVVLSQNKEKGPGYGLLTLSGFGVFNTITLRFESNQINQEHLQHDGNWSTSPASHDCILLERNEDNVVVGLEPTIIDAFLKNTRATYRIIINYDGNEKISPLRIPHNLLGSGAIQKDDPVIDQPEPVFVVPEPQIPENNEPVVNEEITPPPVQEPTDSTVVTEKRPQKKKSPIITIFVTLLLFGGFCSAVGWYFCLIPGVAAGPGCAMITQYLTGDNDTENNDENAVNIEDHIDTDLYTQALSLQKEGKLIEAKAKFQKAATENKHIDAMKRIAEMYDPAFWSAQTSPATESNWETANWWWEMAADNGDNDARRRAGYNMAKHSDFGAEKRKGREILKELADSGDEEAQKMQKEIIGE